MDDFTKPQQIWQHRGFEIEAFRSESGLVEGRLIWEGQPCPYVRFHGTGAVWVVRRARAWIDEYYGGPEGSRIRPAGQYRVTMNGASNSVLATWTRQADRTGWVLEGTDKFAIPGSLSLAGEARLSHWDGGRHVRPQPVATTRTDTGNVSRTPKYKSIFRGLLGF